MNTECDDALAVAQTYESAVSQVFKPAGRQVSLV